MRISILPCFPSEENWSFLRATVIERSNESIEVSSQARFAPGETFIAKLASAEDRRLRVLLYKVSTCEANVGSDDRWRIQAQLDREIGPATVFDAHSIDSVDPKAA